MNKISLSAATIGLSLVATSNVLAAYTDVNPNPDEGTPAEIFSVLYGQPFTSTGLDFTGTTLTARRVSDEQDQLWTGDFAVRVAARFSGYTQTIGSLSRGKYQDLLTAEGLRFDQSANESTVSLDQGVWVRTGDSGTHSSATEFNEDDRDHMITYKMEGNGASPVWVMFWEDIDIDDTITKGRSKSDFNDLVVVVRSAELDGGTPIAVPLPPALGVGLATLGLCGWFIRKRNASRL
jgi:hypothetical protein